MMFPDDIRAGAANVLDACRSKGLLLAAAESCTGGLVAAALTEIAGSSDVFERGFVTYSNASKTSLLGVPADIIDEHGAVSTRVASQMASGALRASLADLSVAITGIAGPGGGSQAKPVGTVIFATARRHETGIESFAERHNLDGTTRAEIRLQAVRVALDLLLARAVEAEGP